MEQIISTLKTRAKSTEEKMLVSFMEDLEQKKQYIKDNEAQSVEAQDVIKSFTETQMQISFLLQKKSGGKCAISIEEMDALVS